MTRLPEDQDWDRLIERVDLDVSAEELAAAERAMREVGATDVAPVSPKWVESTVAKVKQDAEVAAEPAVVAAPVMKPVLGAGWLDGVKRFAAAVLAMVGIHSVGTAAVVGSVGVVTVTAVVFAWSGVFSTANLNYSTAVGMLEDAQQEPSEHRVAIRLVSLRVRDAILALRRARDSIPGQPMVTATAIEQLRLIRRVVDGQARAAPILVDDRAFSESIARMLVANDFGSDPEGVTHVLGQHASLGLSALAQVSEVDPEVRALKQNELRKLSNLLDD